MKKELFDDWASQYDKDVLSDEFPFNGYKQAIDKLIKQLRISHSTQVLEIGVGTGMLLSRFYENGAQCYGFDFSEKMLQIATKRMPSAFLFQHDIRNCIPSQITRAKFSVILAGYTLHHFTQDEKNEIIRQYLSLLKKEDGRMYIFDISFKTQEKLEACKKEQGELWDDQEYYFIEEDMKEEFDDYRYIQYSSCGGLYIFGEEGELNAGR